jgi:hypothetical protein
MKRALLYLVLVFAGIFMVSWVLYPTGSPGGKTGSPGDGSNCTECHAGVAQQATGWITSNIPVTGYIPGQNYTLTAVGTHTGVARFGFEVTSEDAANAKKGTITITDAAQTQLVNAGKAITHTFDGTTPSGDSKSWSFDWIAPASGSGIITFYGAFNAANGNGNTTGDVIYLSTYSVSEASTGITNNIADLADIKTFPNPFTDFLDITFGSLEEPVRRIRISSQDGKMVWARDIQNGTMDKYHIDASSFSKGVYFVTIILSDKEQAVYKVVKN